MVGEVVWLFINKDAYFLLRS